MALFMPDPKEESAIELGMGLANVPFAVPNIRLENPQAAAHTRVGWYRAVSNIPHAFAVQSMVCEMAHAAGRDPKDFLLELLGPARQIDPRDLNDTWNHGENPAVYVLDVGHARPPRRDRLDLEAPVALEEPPGQHMPTPRQQRVTQWLRRSDHQEPPGVRGELVQGANAPIHEHLFAQAPVAQPAPSLASAHRRTVRHDSAGTHDERGRSSPAPSTLHSHATTTPPLPLAWKARARRWLRSIDASRARRRTAARRRSGL